MRAFLLRLNFKKEKYNDIDIVEETIKRIHKRAKQNVGKRKKNRFRCVNFIKLVKCIGIYGVNIAEVFTVHTMSKWNAQVCRYSQSYILWLFNIQNLPNTYHIYSYAVANFVLPKAFTYTFNNDVLSPIRNTHNTNTPCPLDKRTTRKWVK